MVIYISNRGVVRWNNDNHIRPQFKQTFRSIAQAKETYQVIGFMNEYHVNRRDYVWRTFRVERLNWNY